MDIDLNPLKTEEREAIRSQREATETVECGLDFKDISHLSERFCQQIFKFLALVREVDITRPEFFELFISHHL